MAEFGEATQGVAGQALRVIISSTKGGDVSIGISTDNVQVAERICEIAGRTALSLGALYVSYKLLSPLFVAAVTRSLGGEREDQKVQDIKPGSLHVLLHCFTDERFLEVFEDYETGRMKERFQKEFSQVGINLEGLKVEILNLDAVKQTKEGIEVRYLKENFRTAVRVTSARWSPAQRKRLAVEKKKLDHYFPRRVKWIDPTGDTKVETTLKINNDSEYTLRIYIGPDFPNAVPDMVVVSSPRPMPDWGSSYDTHTLGKRDGYLQICHYHQNGWPDRFTLPQVVMKGRLWLEAYEGHLRTESLNYCLREMKG